MLGLGYEAHLKPTEKQEAHLEVLILEEGRWHGLVGVTLKRKKKKKGKNTRIPWWKHLPLALNSKSVVVGVCYVAPGQTVIRNSWNLCFSSFSCSDRQRRKMVCVLWRGDSDLININIKMCENGGEGLSGFCFQPMLGNFCLFCDCLLLLCVCFSKKKLVTDKFQNTSLILV